ncbi:hypothetical protein K456DRAFT_52574 [Colletotrichum gloeosporioides 23]|nr:hypothetical protein K456DRAFT_52574 [Colletotrichum gloeosporioides 23]
MAQGPALLLRRLLLLLLVGGGGGVVHITCPQWRQRRVQERRKVALQMWQRQIQAWGVGGGGNGDEDDEEEGAVSMLSWELVGEMAVESRR